MHSLRLTAPRRFEHVDVPAPTPDDLGPGQVLLRVIVGGICGTDMPYFRGSSTPYRDGLVPDGAIAGFPLHEVVGEVLASAHPRILSGMRVVGWASRYDGLSEILVADGDELHAYRPSLAPAKAVLIQPLACVLYAMKQLQSVRDRSVAVIGQGAIGSLFSHVAATEGATDVQGVDVVDRSALRDRILVDRMWHRDARDWAETIPGTGGADVVIDAIGHRTDTLEVAVRAVRAGGEIYCFGVPDAPIYPFPMAEFVRKGVSVRGGFTGDRARVLAAADRYLERFPSLIDTLVTDVVPIADAQSGFERAEAPDPARLKVVLAREDGTN